MAEPHRTFDQQQHVEAHAPYIKVWMALLVLTVLEYVYAKLFASGYYSLILGLMVLAFIKAGLVGWYFMHLKFEGNWVYYMLIPAGLLATLFIIALYPDIGMTGTAPAEEDEEIVSAPLDPSAGRAAHA